MRTLSIEKVRLRRDTSTKPIVHPETESSQITDWDDAVQASAYTKFIPVVEDYYYRPSLMVPHKTYVTVPAGTRFVVNGRYYEVTSDMNVTVPSDNHVGKDMYLYACENSTVNSTTPVFIISLNSTYPTGYTANTSRKLGGFHGLCASVGTISDHPLSGYNAGEILPASVWDLKHRPIADPEGMVYSEELGKWVDIYLASYDGSKLVSAYGAVVADGYSGTPFNGFKFDQYFAKVKKRSPWQYEFMSFSTGSNQGTNVSGSNDKDTSGGWSDTNNRRMISNIGCEDCCGFMWQWALDSGGPFRYNNDNDTTSGNDVTWADVTSHGYKNQYDENVDDLKQLGDGYATPARALVGGNWNNGSHCGSRCSNWNNGPLNRNDNIGGRGVCAGLEM